jgi:hypothetical protein
MARVIGFNLRKMNLRRLVWLGVFIWTFVEMAFQTGIHGICGVRIRLNPSAYYA